MFRKHDLGVFISTAERFGGKVDDQYVNDLKSQLIIKDQKENAISIICHPFSYGGDDGLFEIAIIKNGGLCHTSISGGKDDTVRGYMEVEEVQKAIEDFLTGNFQWL